MNLFSKTTIAALLVVGCAAAGRAQELTNPLLPQEGTREIALRGNLFFQPNDTYNLQGKYGPFVSDRLQVAGTFGFDKSGGAKSTLYGVEANYHFPSASPTLPFVGAFFGGANISGGSGGGKVNSTAYGFQGGVKHFLNSSVAATGEFQYRHPTGRNSKDTTALVFGLAVFLR